MGGHVGMSNLAQVAPLLASCLLMAVVTACAPAAAPDNADAGAEPTKTQEPPGDCWGGALGEDPLHCHVLEEAQRAGKFRVVEVYEAPNDVLHVILDREKTLKGDFELAEFLVDRGYEFVSTPQGDSHREWLRQTDIQRFGRPISCEGLEGDRLKACEVGGQFRSVAIDRGRLERPAPRSHSGIRLHVGGPGARREQGGWASWRQLWPTPSTDGSQGVSGSGGFDVSDVDSGNIPEPDCALFSSGQAYTCMLWKRYPATGIAGIEWDNDLISYIQVKGPLPTDEAELDALKRRLDDQYGQSLGPDFVRLIPVKYDFGQMWRWSEILNRFALSAGNTIGIKGAEISINSSAHVGDTVFLQGLRDWGGNWDDGDAVARIRATVGAGALDVEAVVEALPELLPLLGIPVDAVGVVGEVRR